jgi:Na+/H+ antiporter NhaD/arsenite permease-like protein
MIPSLAIFAVCYFFIATERIDKTITALLGAFLMIAFHLISYESALAKVDLNVIYLLIGMMVIVNILASTGVFEWIAIVVARKANGNGVRLLLLLCIVTAVLSAFLDNVTTVILIAPVTILITQLLEIPTAPFLIMEAIASNIGGAGTLIGDPPNILIGSQSHLTFNDFIFHLGPIAIIVLLITLLIQAMLYGKQFTVSDKAKQRLTDAFPEEAIIYPDRLRKALIVLGLVFAGFFTGHLLHIETGVTALAGAMLMALVCRINIHQGLAKVEWNTILFFVGLFMLVGGLEENGLFELLGHQLIDMTNGNLMKTCIAMLWFSAIFSACVDNIPLVIATIPIIQTIIPEFATDMNLVLGSAEANTSIAEPLYWSLALGACLGGNGTLIGASANVVVAQIAERNNYRLSFMDFTRQGFPMMLLSAALATVYVYLRYFLPRA